MFFCVWEDRSKSSERSRGQDRWGQLTRLRSVLLGERGLVQQTLEIVISGYKNQAESGDCVPLGDRNVDRNRSG